MLKISVIMELIKIIMVIKKWDRYSETLICVIKNWDYYKMKMIEERVQRGEIKGFY